MPTAVDLTGKTFGRLLVQSRAPDFVQPSGARQTAWRVLCKCGVQKIVRAETLRNGRTQSCGCLSVELTTRRSTKHGAAIDMRNVPPEYSAWMNMKHRCYWKGHLAYANYGGRGITVCKRWASNYSAFLSDMGPRPSVAHTLDRINNDGNYSPSNCRWATRKEQNNNRRPFRK